MITFDPLWRTLKAKIAKLSKDGNIVMLDVVDRISKALEVPIYDVVEAVEDYQDPADQQSS